MKGTIFGIFKILGGLLLGLLLWGFLLGGPIDWDTGRVSIEHNVAQQTMWEQGRNYNENQWVLATGKDGQLNTGLEHAAWESATSVVSYDPNP